MPESFSVLIHELRGLCLDTQLLGGETDSRRAPDATEPSKANTAPTGVASDDLLSGALTL